MRLAVIDKLAHAHSRTWASILVILLGLSLAGCIPATHSAAGRNKASELKSAIPEADEDVARDASKPISERFDTEWFEKNLSQPRFFSRHLVEKHRHDKPSLKIARSLKMELPVYKAQSLLATPAGVYLATCLDNCRPYAAGMNDPVLTDLAFATPENKQIRKIADTGDQGWEIIHIFPYGNKGIGWVENMLVERGNGDDSTWAPWRIKACKDTNNCRPQLLYEEKSGETILECSPHAVHGMQLLCWYSKATTKEGYPHGIYSLLHLDMGKNPAKGEVLVEDSPEAYGFVWQKSGDIVFIGQWGCQEFACQGDTPQSVQNRPVEFRQTSFKEFPKNKIIKTLNRKTTPSLTWASGNGKYVTWVEGNANPFLIGYSAVRKYLDLENGGPIRVLGEDSTLVNADASDKYITFYSAPASKLYLVNPQDNTAIVLQTDSESEDANNGRLYPGNLAISGDSVAWINTKSAPPEVSVPEAMKNYRATLHVAKIVPVNS